MGTHTRYQLKKMMKTKEEQIPKLKNKCNLNFQNKNQMDIINEIKNNEFNDTIIHEAIKSLNIKLSSYKQQDILKKKFNIESFVKFSDLIDKLIYCNLNCYYCSSNILILYDKVRDNKQWTLDRIDNENGHNKENVVIACLECNLKRRNIKKDAFLFTKQFKIIREEYIDQK
jgi:5-methylcytosine-specific restriction endonuclease McrA